MRNKSFATLGALALLVAGTALGQSRLVADIPFEFQYANQILPAGHYEVTQTSNTLRVSNFENRVGAFSTLNNLGPAANPNAGSHLTFNKYGDQYFLAEVWVYPATNDGAAVVKSKAEREIASGSPAVARVEVPVRKAAARLASLR